MLKRMLKQVICITMILTLGLGLVACSTKGSNTTAKVTENSDGRYEVPEMGITYTIPQEMIDEGIEVEPYNWNMNEYYLSEISYYYRPITDALFDEMYEKSEEERAAFEDEFYEKMYAHTRALLCIVAVEIDEYEKQIAAGKSLDDISCFTQTEELTEKDGYVYLISIPEYELDNVDVEELNQFNKCHEYMQTVKDSIEITGINESMMAGETPNLIDDFTTYDLEGNEVTEGIFSEKGLTIVNIWGTFCSPCIEEMPDLGVWAGELPEKVQIIGIVQDISGLDDTEHLDLAKQITEKANANFTQLIGGNGQFEELMASVVGVPTTVFVDKFGNIVGDPIVGADIDAYKAFVEEYLNE